MSSSTSTQTVIRAEHISKSFKLPHEKVNSIKNIFAHFGSYIRKSRSFEEQHALQDISFEVKKGEFFGIVGRNGSGKSTLLKLLAGIYTPSQGEIAINGRLTPFIELGVGFNMELTGRENVFLNGALLGFSRKEMEAMYESIVEFAEIERFMDQKLKNYSSGMQVRLAFSIAIKAQSEILLIDEVLAVGDASFQQKCFDVFAELKKKGTTIILVTHDMSSVLRFCDRAMLIHKSKVVQTGKPALVAEAYLELNYENTEKQRVAQDDAVDATKPQITSVTPIGRKDNDEHTFKTGEEVKLSIKYKNPQKTPTHFGFQIFNEAGVYCFGANTLIDGCKPEVAASGKMDFSFEADLLPGSYYITVAAMNDTATVVHSYKTRAVSFRINKDTQLEGIAMLPHKWS
jgi:ABC-2 type transport system ATP-binding protein